MAPELSLDTKATLLLIGDCSNLVTRTALQGVRYVECSDDAHLLLQAIADQGDRVLIFVIQAWDELSKKTQALLTQEAKYASVLGIGEGSSPFPSVEIYDAFLPLDSTEALPTMVPMLLRLAKTRRDLFEQKRDLVQQQRMLDQVAMAIISTDLNGVIKSWNQRAEVIFGYSETEAIGRNLSIIFQQAQQRDFNMHSLLEPLLIHDRHQFETEIRRGDGVQLPIQVSMSLEKNNQLDIIGVICCCRDISLRRRVEVERSDAFERLSFFIDRMPLAFIEWDTECQIRAWNDSAEEIFGYSQKEAIGQSFSMLIEEEFVEKAHRLFCEMREQKRSNRSQNTNLTRSGEKIICEWINSSLLDERGNVVGYASIVNDVTEQIRIENELKESRESAFAANRSKDEFLAVMSHEVRTPMNSIIGFADLLMESLKSEDDVELVNIIKANAFNLLELINNVLNYSRLEAGEIELKVQDTDLTALCHEIQEVTQAEVKEKNLSFAIEFEPDTPRNIMADLTELRQVLLNLTANALKFTQMGGVTISISAHPLPASDPWSWEFLFAVKDTGIGISDSDQSKLFQSFTQLDSSSTRRFGGTGLGLAICRRIVELWDGKIWAESNLNEGSTFYFTLPTRENELADGETVTGLLYEEIEDRRFAEIFPLSILLLCPNHATGEVLGKVMSSMGYEIAMHHDGIEAISHLQDHGYDIVMIDDDLNDFTLSEMLELIRSGNAGESNISANLIALLENNPQNKASTPQSRERVEFIYKPIIARNVRSILRKIAIGRDAVKH
ncbi:PAS domain S-box protein [Cerasicoccus maritimus]|uniref:PAS domain S-box protein n=1 Tax=Cerasicoccus maritimus TaxID=490089 RepID=UPI002852BA88|nr:PAS domain S-box protein [Cerasicoccus maritimus]